MLKCVLILSFWFLVLLDAHRERQIHSEKQIVPCCECEVAKERKQNNGVGREHAKSEAAQKCESK